MSGSVSTFRERAPLVDTAELSDLIVKGIIHPETRAAAESIWLQNSFVDPNRDIDENDTPSDLDVFVLIPDWEFPVADTGLAATVPAVENPEPHPSTDNVTWDSKDGKWTEGAESFWEVLPEHARGTFARSLQKGFYASETDREAGLIRTYDVTIGDRTDFEYDQESHARLQLYPENEVQDG